ncbi:conserved hypothetical protein [Ricinus communis]|uniref:Uncharacterized protein n=1 Tax=Ricinus communis TaxID=3988 RepID=B9SEX6_RICCO|nr:conserved hypothetical protein [Ricinus communis]
MDKELPLEGREHNQPLYIEAMVKGIKSSCVMVDDRSRINICPLRFLDKYGLEKTDLEPTSTVIRACDESKRQACRTFKALVKLRPIESVTELMVLDILISFAFFWAGLAILQPEEGKDEKEEPEEVAVNLHGKSQSLTVALVDHGNISRWVLPLAAFELHVVGDHILMTGQIHQSMSYRWTLKPAWPW